MRGRGGTEGAIPNHASGEAFTLLDDAITALDGALIGNGPATIVAEGLGDLSAASSTIGLRGLSRRPLSPVHARSTTLPDGTRRFEWTRRARGAWTWDDGVDAPLHEQAETYVVTFGALEIPVASWMVEQSRLSIDAATLIRLGSSLRDGALQVRQQGSYALSEPLLLATLM